MQIKKSENREVMGLGGVFEGLLVVEIGLALVADLGIELGEV